MAKKRCEFKDKYKWNLKDLYNSDEDCKKELREIEDMIKSFSSYKGNFTNSASRLLELLNLDTQISKKMEKAYIYAHINNDADTLNTNYQELYGIAKNVYAKYLKETSFIVPELLKVDYNIILKYLDELDELKDYKHNLKNIFRNKEHVLTSEVEEAVSSLAPVINSFDEIASSLTDSDFKYDSIVVDGKKVELTESNYQVYLRSPDRNIRKKAFHSLYKTYSQFKNSLSATLRNEVLKNVVLAKMRGFNNSLECSLFNNEIDTSVYQNLIKSVHKNMNSIYKYWDLKKDMLKLKKMHIYDTYADVISVKQKKYSFEEAKELVLKAILPLGDVYQKDILKSFTDGWIDSCNNEGKRGGAYCTACYLSHPYVLLNYEGLLNDVSTLAHELGHAMHYYYACKSQKYQDYNYSIFVAEVASQVNEILLCRYLLDNSTDKSDKIKIIDDLLQKYKSTIFRQTMFAEFELFIHEYTEKGGVLTHENMCDKYYELNKLYFGNNVIVDDEIKYEWERIPHFYMNFYVWQYATGFAAAVKIANDIYGGNEEARLNYLEFLKIGSTKNPIDSLKVAGVDMTKEYVLDDAIVFMNDLMQRYELLKGSESNE